MSWNDGTAGPFGRDKNDPEQNNDADGTFAGGENHGNTEPAASEQPGMPSLPPLPPLQPNSGAEQGKNGEQAHNSEQAQGSGEADSASSEQTNADAPGQSAGDWSSFAPPSYNDASGSHHDAQGETPSWNEAEQEAGANSFAAALGSDGDVNASRDEPHADEPGATRAYDFGASDATATTPYNRDELQGQGPPADQQPTQAFPPQSFRADEPATQSFGAPPAAFPGDANAGAYGAGYAQNTAPAGGNGSGNGTPNDGEKKKKPLFRRKSFIITAIVAAVVIIAAAVGIPWFIHTQNVQRGDDLAADFQSQLDDYNKTWNEENLATVTSPDISSVMSSSSQTFFDLTTDGVDQLSAACADISGAQETHQQLTDADVPELPADEGATASEAYQQAQDDADALASSRENADAFLEQSQSLLTSQQQLCDSLPAYAELQQNYRDDLNTTMPDAYVIENGGEITTSDGAIYFPCSNASGCPDLYNSDTREQFASAYESTYVDYYNGLVKQYTENCFLDAFQSVCDTAASEYQKAADANQAVVDHLRNTEPTVEVGETLYPELDGLLQDATSAESAANDAVLAEWQSIEPNVGSSMTRTGSSIATYLDGLKSSAEETAGSIVG